MVGGFGLDVLTRCLGAARFAAEGYENGDDKDAELAARRGDA